MILVSDTSVLIDLQRGGLLEALFALPHEFAVPDVLYDHEMQGDWGEGLVRLGLRVEEVSKEGVANALRYRQQRATLSVPDSFALALAMIQRWAKTKRIDAKQQPEPQGTTGGLVAAALGSERS